MYYCDGGVCFTATNRAFPAYQQAVGLAPDGRITSGCDDTLYDPRDCQADGIADRQLTPVERVELADHMIAEWTRIRGYAQEDLRCPP